MLGLGGVILIGLLLLTLLGLRWTDRLGWTAIFARRDRGSSVIGSVILGADNIFAPEHKRAAIEHRLDRKDILRQQKLGDDGPFGQGP